MNKYLITAFSIILATTSAFAAPLQSKKPIPLTGKAARFDFMTADKAMHRILAAHKGAGTLEILDVKSGKPLQAVQVGEAQGVAVDTKGHRYFLGNDGDHNVVVIDAQTLKKLAEIKVDGPVDAIAFDDKNGMLFADRDNGDHIWVIDAKTNKVASKIVIPGEPEVIEYDADTDRLYQNIKDKNLVVRIDPASNKIDATWETLPVTSPHGLAIDGGRGRVYTAGSNGKLVAIELKSGTVVASVDIPPGVDQIAFDGKDTIYCACKGYLAAVKVTDASLESLGNVQTAKGAHTLAVDPISHDVWVSYSNVDHSYFQKFKASAK